ncbi:T9SS type A sorting domain-containing protein [Flavobacterium zepuense]|uniref:T9SS type A sorting domain-containing protein n=1 Tax=Flavobacterium zepuense TaxID=2593302 RepID=A0A552V7U8_9FLAO|nr:T9SS type A sorting domain-containing protein [Flavobacterium zepuense]TRW26539.1 T9SS type A sorting domain-containing protein [Flavobacterium zepuense]
MKIKITLLVLFFATISQAQVSNQGQPQSWSLNNIENPEAVVMPQFDLKALRAEDKINDAKQDKPYRYGHEFLVDHTLQNSGKWTTLPNGDRIWRMRYLSKGAQTLNFLFTDFYMPKGATLYLYNANHTDLLGAYDDKQNNAQRVLGTWLVAGEDITIEYFEPAEQAGQGKLEIFKVVHGYRSLSATEIDPDSGLNASGSCMYDVECYIEGINSLKEISKKSVALIIVGNSNWCTGSLINNTSNDGTPYFLTADHCYSDPSQWAFMFNWINPNPSCATGIPSTNNAPNYHLTVSGAELKARREESDFTLVEITTGLPDDWGLVWSGWDRSTTIPQFSYGIHHPAGDIMKVSLDYDSPTMVNDNGDFGIVWDIANWEIGGLQPGSSGSPMFDNNGRIRGQAWYIYGASVCNGLNAGGQSSGYGRFNVSWDAGSTPSARLKEWLDPQNTGALTTDTYPLQPVYTVDAKTIFTELGNNCNSIVAPAIRIINNGTQNLTSAQINYTLNGVTEVLSWMGNLATNESDVVELPQSAGAAGENTIAVTITSPNGTSDQNESDNVISAIVTVVEGYPAQQITLTLLTDNYGEEVSWELTNENGEVLYSVEEGAYANATTYTEVFDIVDGGCYNFSIYDSFGDGICCAEGNGGYVLSTADNQAIQLGGNYGTGEQTSLRIESVLSIGQAALNGEAKVYPNPSNGLFTVKVPSGYSPNYTVYNLLGQEVTKGLLTNNLDTVNLSNAAAGVYLLKVIDAATGSETSFKLIKQ